MATNATPSQIQTWQQQNATLLSAQRQRAVNLGNQSSLDPLPLASTPRLPPNASPALKDFLTGQAALANARAQIHNQLLDQLPSNPTADQIAQMHQAEETQFTQQQAAALKLQSQRAQALAAESAQQPLPLPPPLVLRPNTTPQLAAFLTAKDQLMREQIQLSNQLLTATPAARNAALQTWQKQNATRFQHLQQLAQNLSQPTPPPQN